MLVGVIVVLFALAYEAIFGLRCDGRVAPFALRFEEQCERVGADLNSICDGVLNTYWRAISIVSNQCFFFFSFFFIYIYIYMRERV